MIKGCGRGYPVLPVGQGGQGGKADAAELHHSFKGEDAVGFRKGPHGLGGRALGRKGKAGIRVEGQALDPTLRPAEGPAGQLRRARKVLGEKVLLRVVVQPQVIDGQLDVPILISVGRKADALGPAGRPGFQIAGLAQVIHPYVIGPGFQIYNQLDGVPGIGPIGQNRSVRSAVDGLYITVPVKQHARNAFAGAVHKAGRQLPVRDGSAQLIFQDKPAGRFFGDGLFQQPDLVADFAQGQVTVHAAYLAAVYLQLRHLGAGRAGVAGKAQANVSCRRAGRQGDRQHILLIRMEPVVLGGHQLGIGCSVLAALDGEGLGALAPVVPQLDGDAVHRLDPPQVHVQEGVGVVGGSLPIGVDVAVGSVAVLGGGGAAVGHRPAVGQIGDNRFSFGGNFRLSAYKTVAVRQAAIRFQAEYVVCIILISSGFLLVLPHGY